MSTYLLIVMLTSTHPIPVQNLVSLAACEQLGKAISKDLVLSGAYYCYEVPTSAVGYLPEQATGLRGAKNKRKY